MFLARDVEWRNKIVSTFRDAGFPEGEQQWGLLAMSAIGTSRHFAAPRNSVAIGVAADIEQVASSKQLPTNQRSTDDA
jgi:hypothetical protein